MHVSKIVSPWIPLFINPEKFNMTSFFAVNGGQMAVNIAEYMTPHWIFQVHGNLWKGEYPSSKGRSKIYGVPLIPLILQTLSMVIESFLTLAHLLLSLPIDLHLPCWNKKSREQKVAGTNCCARILRNFATFSSTTISSHDFLLWNFARQLVPRDF